MKRKGLLCLLFILALGIIFTTISFATWEIRYLENNSGQVEENLYSIQYHYGDSSTKEKVSSLELTSGFELLVFDETPEDLANGKYVFLGWKVGTESSIIGSTIYTNLKSHTIKDLLEEYVEVPSDNIIHLWECWTTTIPSSKVLLTISYNTNDYHYQLVGASSIFSLINIVIPGYTAEYFIYDSKTYNINEFIDLSSKGGQNVEIIAI